MSFEIINTCATCDTVYFKEKITRNRCVVCKSDLPKFYCTMCKDWLPNELFYRTRDGYGGGRCKSCYKSLRKRLDDAKPEQKQARIKKYMVKRRAELEQRYIEWKEKCDSIPFVTLTEEGWLNACSTFNGCAICGESYIESRQMFIAFENGGRYTPWNVFPACGICSVKGRLLENTFIWIDKLIGTSQIKDDRRTLLVNYLTAQLDKHTPKGGSTK